MIKSAGGGFSPALLWKGGRLNDKAGTYLQVPDDV